ncbi:hypothetical protein M0208_13265 [Sphingomonas sp. SUN019]|uniref:hypothetical protein n=1 Tax=Sphingomonas sp. SUN019 TaxID=2937788 RepID=UPI0021640F34|nr:hypothetical protein [Sphingomonas sp. SUN019]UVO51426.1 hypothetical protein M0208_13265 [Sphingomonas sp. SUN019]
MGAFIAVGLAWIAVTASKVVRRREARGYIFLRAARRHTLFVMMAGCPRVASAILVVAVLIEADDRRLRGHARQLQLAFLHRAHEMLATIQIGRLHHDLVVAQIEMVMNQRDSESIKTTVFLKDGANVIQTRRIDIVDRLHIGNMLQGLPLNRGYMNSHSHLRRLEFVERTRHTRGMTPETSNLSGSDRPHHGKVTLSAHMGQA